MLPSIAYAPWQILLWAVVPLLLLAWSNYLNFQTIVGDLKQPDRNDWLAAIGSGSVLALCFAVLAVVAWWGGRRVSHWFALAGMISVVGFLNFALWGLVPTIPRAAQWILSPDTVIVQNLTGATPALLYFGGILCSRRSQSMAFEFRNAIVCVFAIGMCLVLFFGSVHSQLEFWMAPAAVGISLAMLFCLLAALRVLLVVGRRLSGLSRAGLVLLGLWVGLLLPMIGLWVNNWVPFPYDFQVPWVYAFTAFNGVLLSVPVPANNLARRLLWISQCFGLPFTLYFFVVFMPFLPLTAPGLMVWGGGLLVLVPACVLMLHAFRVIDGFRRERDLWAGSRLWVPALAGAAAFAVVPGSIVVRAGMDRTVLHAALDYVYTASPQDSRRFDGEPRFS